MKKQSWRPDWQEDDQYPQPENTSLNYLRILDALEAKTTPEQIGCALYPKLPRESQLQRVRDDITAAKRLCDYDYWRIPLTRAKK